MTSNGDEKENVQMLLKFVSESISQALHAYSVCELVRCLSCQVFQNVGLIKYFIKLTEKKRPLELLNKLNVRRGVILSIISPIPCVLTTALVCLIIEVLSRKSEWKTGYRSSAIQIERRAPLTSAAGSRGKAKQKFRSVLCHISRA